VTHFVPEPLSGLPKTVTPGGIQMIRDVLRQRQVPFLLVGEKGEVLDPSADAPTTIMAPLKPLQCILEDDERKDIVEHAPAAETGLPRQGEHTALLAWVPSPYEAGIVQARLDCSGITYQTSHMTSQLPFTTGDLAGSEIYVAESDLDRAHRAIAIDEKDASEEDDTSLQQARLARRFRIARFFLYTVGLGYVAMSLFAFGVHMIDGLVHFGLGLLLMVLAHASHRTPRLAFLWSFLVLAVSSSWAMLADRPFLLIPGFGCLVAVYFAWEATGSSRD
jgi:hypothetical protein